MVIVNDIKRLEKEPDQDSDRASEWVSKKLCNAGITNSTVISCKELKEIHDCLAELIRKAE
jgi:hypothetical protein